MADASREKKALRAKTRAGISTPADRASAHRSSTNAKAIEDLIAKAAANARAKVTPWEAQAIVLPVVRQYCRHCQAVHTYTGGSILVRFRHRKNGTIWETAGHPSQQNPNLPRVIRYLDQSLETCHECFTSSPHIEEDSPQIPLPLPFVKKSLNIFPTKETLIMTEQKLNSHPVLPPYSRPTLGDLWPEEPFGGVPEPDYFPYGIGKETKSPREE